MLFSGSSNTAQQGLKTGTTHNYTRTNWATTYVDGSQNWFPNLLEINIKVSTGLKSELSLFDSILGNSFVANFLDLRSLESLTLLDHIILFTSHPKRSWGASPQILFTRLATDWVPQNSLLLYPVCFIYQYEQHNAEDIITMLAPEIVDAMSQHVNAYWVTRTLCFHATAAFNTLVFYTEPYFLKASGFLILVLSLPSLLFFTAIIFSLVLTQLNKLLPLPVVRAYTYLYKTSVSMASNFEFIFFFATSLSLYLLMLLLMSDDISEQVYELINSYYLIIFTYLILVLVLVYSIHIFAFLSLTTYSKRSLLVIVRQFKNDIMDLLSLIMRFYVLLFRLNVYDLLEDLFDGYYIFLGDFGDEYLLDTLLIPVNSLEGFTLNNTEENFDFEDTNSGLNLDIFRVYYVMWGQFTYFYIFCLEEGARLLLASYIVFLIFFEIHATNMRFLERYATNLS